MDSFIGKCGTTIRVGDTITAYHAGIHRVTKIEARTMEKHRTVSPLVEYSRILNAKFKPQRGNNQCDAGFCRAINVQILKDMKQKKIEEVSSQFDAAIIALS